MVAPIQDSKTIQFIIDKLKLSTTTGHMPMAVADFVHPVFIVNNEVANYVTEVFSAMASNSTQSVILATDASRDFYLTGIQLHVIKDATATSLYSTVDAVIGGATKELARISGFTLTAQNENIVLNFTHPVRIDRATNITVNNSTNVGNVKATAVIYGFFY